MTYATVHPATGATVRTFGEIPFGGIKNSGFGRELSELGFGEFVNRKLVNVARADSPPWGPAPVLP